MWLRMGAMVVRKEVKPGKGQGLEEPVCERVTGRLLRGMSWLGIEDGKEGGLGGSVWR
jgi:hypothetical protein